MGRTVAFAERAVSGIAIAAYGIGKSFGDFHALSDVNIEVARGEFVSLVGPSGSGKTTLLRLLGGFEQPDTGRICIDGREVTAMPPERRSTNTVFQRGALFPHLTVAENIGYPLRRAKVLAREITRRVDELLDVVRLTGFGSRKPSELSGGQAQRVALARALASRPPVLLLDEPFSALDLALRKELQLELRRIHHDLDCAFVFVTHDQEEALVLSDRIAIMDGGRIVQCGPPSEVYSKPTTIFTSQFIGQMNLINTRIVGIESAQATINVGGLTLEVDLSDQTLAVGSDALFLVRPENITLRAHEPGLLDGRVEEVVYLGSRWRVRVNCPSLGAALWSETSIHEMPANVDRGTQVSLLIRPRLCRLMTNKTQS
jgi:spermidine/putrescine transport system ATP-binding protein